MGNEKKASVNFFWKCFLLILLDVIAAANFTDYYREYLYADLVCLQSASKLTGVFSLMTACALKCTQTDGCRSFFYSGLELNCYIVNSVLTSRDGCDFRVGTTYYIRQADSDCYHLTENDNTKMLLLSVPEKDQCERYQFHVYTAGNSLTKSGCNGCICCQKKGCYSGSSRNYNGTWSLTKYGRRCQRWDSQSPHAHNRNSPYGFPQDASVFDAHNYCRDPDYENSLWCYTEDPSIRWEYCNIPKC